MSADDTAMARIQGHGVRSGDARRHGETLVRVTGVTRRYRERTVLDEVTLQAGVGECLALLGHNGAGKTTLFKLMLGLIRPDSGSITIDGCDPGDAAFDELKRSIGFLPENVAFHDAMTGEEALAFYARLKGVPLGSCPGLLEQVGLAEAAGRRIRTYSKGMRQRLGLAQALLGAPRLLLLDEPTTGLDPALRRSFFERIGALQRSGVTIIISSHALAEIEGVADQVAILRCGTLVADGSPAELKRRAGLPARVRLRLAPGGAPELRRRLGDRFRVVAETAASITLGCKERDKKRLLEEVAALDVPIEDIDISSPGLDDVYAHFTSEEPF